MAMQNLVRGTKPADSWAGLGPVVIHGVPWDRYEALVRLLGDDYPALRLTYLRGTLEIMTTSPDHENIKKIIARLLEMWAVERDVHLNGYGSATFRKQVKERGLEPDECYTLGPLIDVPDIAIEVAWSRGIVDKLEVYAGLGVREVWLWDDGKLAVHALVGEAYERKQRSQVLPDLDLDELCSFVRLEDQTQAVRAYRDALQRG